MVFYKRLNKVDFVKVAFSVLVSIAESQENCFLEVVSVALACTRPC